MCWTESKSVPCINNGCVLTLGILGNMHACGHVKGAPHMHAAPFAPLPKPLPPPMGGHSIK